MKKYLTRKQLFNKINNSCLQPNYGKLLTFYNNRKAFFWTRDRKPDTTYYFVQIKGNYIRAFKINYSLGLKINIDFFSDAAIPAILTGIRPDVKATKVLIVKTKLKEYKNFAIQFKQKSDSLEWNN